MTRHPDTYDGGGEAVYGDVADQESLRAALRGTRAAYYLVHSLDSEDFEQRDAEAATAFGHAAADAGVGQIIYLGGLGDLDDNLSAHLRSRRDVEQLLGTRRGAGHRAAGGGRRRVTAASPGRSPGNWSITCRP